MDSLAAVEQPSGAAAVPVPAPEPAQVPAEQPAVAAAAAAPNAASSAAEVAAPAEQPAAAAAPDAASSSSAAATTDAAASSSSSAAAAPLAAPAAGVLFVAGSVAHSMTGRSGKTQAFDGVEETNLYRYAVYGPLKDVPVSRVVSGPNAVHFVALTPSGVAYAWGRNDKGQLGNGRTTNVYRAAKLFVPGGAPIVAAACGRNHTLLVTAGGDVLAAGAGPNGQLGIGKVVDSQATWAKSVKGLPEAAADPVVKVGCGGDFSLALTRSGRVFACGTGENGVLGNGATGERIVTAGRVGFDTAAQWIPVAFPAGTPPIADIACGTVHAVARTTDGQVFTWGSGAYGRLGHKEQKDELRPRRIKETESPAFRAELIAAGASFTYVSTTQGMLFMCGRTKATGEANMYLKPVSDLIGWRPKQLAGGFTSTLVAAEDRIVAWGPSPTCGELGYGEETKSSTKAKFVDDLSGTRTVSLALGYATALVVLDVSSATKEGQVGAALAGKPVPAIEGVNAAEGVPALAVYDPPELVPAAGGAGDAGAAAAGGKRKAGAGAGAGAGAAAKKGKK